MAVITQTRLEPSTTQARLNNTVQQAAPARTALQEFGAALANARTGSIPVRRDGDGGSGDRSRMDALGRVMRDAMSNKNHPLNQALFGFTVTQTDDGVVIDTHEGNDDVTVERLPDGRLKIQVKGSLFAYYVDPTDQGTVTIRTGDGNDKVTVEDGVDRGLTIDGGDDDDTIKIGNGVQAGFTIYGGEGADTIEGGAGNDRVFGGGEDDYIDGGGGNDLLYGQAGYDVIYGLDGDDIIYGGAGRDYVDAGAGNDKVYGEGGNDVLSGGRDNDLIFGGAGDDVMITAAGQDRAEDYDGSNVVYAEDSEDVRINGRSRRVTVEARDELGESISITADGLYAAGESDNGAGERFIKRMESDLDTLRYIPAGQSLLASLDASGRHVTIKRTDGIKNEHEADSLGGYLQPDGTPGAGSDSVVSINPYRREIYGGTEPWREVPPLIGLYHELVHSEDSAYGTLPEGKSQEEKQKSSNAELSATGLPWDQDGDGVNDPNLRENTENALRADLGWPDRESYGDPEYPTS